MNWNTILPTRFVIDGLQGDGAWRPLARFGEAQALQLLDALRANPRQASLGFDVGGQTVSGVRMRVEEGGTSFEGWSMPEFEIWVP
jgi:hypothetical protein